MSHERAGLPRPAVCFRLQGQEAGSADVPPPGFLAPREADGPVIDCSIRLLHALGADARTMHPLGR